MSCYCFTIAILLLLLGFTHTEARGVHSPRNLKGNQDTPAMSFTSVAFGEPAQSVAATRRLTQLPPWQAPPNHGMPASPPPPPPPSPAAPPPPNVLPYWWKSDPELSKRIPRQDYKFYCWVGMHCMSEVTVNSFAKEWLASDAEGLDSKAKDKCNQNKEICGRPLCYYEPDAKSYVAEMGGSVSGGKPCESVKSVPCTARNYGKPGKFGCQDAG